MHYDMCCWELVSNAVSTVIYCHQFYYFLFRELLMKKLIEMLVSIVNEITKQYVITMYASMISHHKFALILTEYVYNLS